MRCFFTGLIGGLLIALLAAPTWAQEPADPADETQSETTTDEADDTADSAPAAEPVERAKLPDFDARFYRLLSAETDEDALVWLGDEPQQMLGLHLPINTAQPQGAALLVFSGGESLDQSSALNNLRRSLPDAGWQTLAIRMPLPPETVIPERSIAATPITSEAPEAAEEGAAQGTADGAQEDDGESTDTAAAATADAASAAAADANNGVNDPASAEADSGIDAVDLSKQREERQQAYVDEALQRLEIALQFLRDKGQFNIVIIAQDQAALGVETFMSSEYAGNNRGVQGIVSINTLLTDLKKRPPVDNRRLRFLDVFAGAPRQVDGLADKRRGQARRNGMVGYEQLRYQSLVQGSRANSSMARRINSWIRAHFRGSEVR